MNVHSLSNPTSKTYFPKVQTAALGCFEALATKIHLRTSRGAESFGTRRGGTPLHYSTHVAAMFRISSATLVAQCVKQPGRAAVPRRIQRMDLALVVL